MFCKLPDQHPVQKLKQCGFRTSESVTELQESSCNCTYSVTARTLHQRPWHVLEWCNCPILKGKGAENFVWEGERAGGGADGAFCSLKKATCYSAWSAPDHVYMYIYLSTYLCVLKKSMLTYQFGTSTLQQIYHVLQKACLTLLYLHQDCTVPCRGLLYHQFHTIMRLSRP